MSTVGEVTSVPETNLRWKMFCYSSQGHLTPETFVSSFDICLSFVSFVFVFWPIETTTANLQGLTHSNSSKSTNQVTLISEHMNLLFGRKVTCFTIPYFPLFMVWWPKEGHTCLIAQRQWHLRCDILKNEKFDVKKLIPKISEEFSVVVTWPLQMLGLKGCRYASVITETFSQWYMIIFLKDSFGHM